VPQLSPLIEPAMTLLSAPIELAGDWGHTLRLRIGWIWLTEPARQIWQRSNGPIETQQPHLGFGRSLA
jgi:hypothetical protein